MNSIKKLTHLKQIFEKDVLPPIDDNPSKKGWENIDHTFNEQEARQNFFMKAFELYLNKTISKNKERQNPLLNSNSPLRRSSQIWKEDELMNLPENMRNVVKLMRSRKKRTKLMEPNKSEKFEKKMEIFKDLNSFVDIRRFLLESNITNYQNSEELIANLKSHYKEGLEEVLQAEEIQSNRSGHVYHFNPRPNRRESKRGTPSNFLLFEQNMKKYKNIIDISKEMVRTEGRGSQTEKAELSSKLCSHLTQNLNQLKNELEGETSEETKEDAFFKNSLEKLENRCNYQSRYLMSPIRRKGLSSLNLSEDVAKRHQEEVQKFDEAIKKTILRGVVGEDGEAVTNGFYLQEYKKQYERIKRVLRRVTKNIFKRDPEAEKNPLHLQLTRSSINRSSLVKDSPGLNPIKLQSKLSLALPEQKESTGNPMKLQSKVSFTTERKESLGTSLKLQSKPSFITEIKENAGNRSGLQSKISFNDEQKECQDPYFLNHGRDSSFLLKKKTLEIGKFKNNQSVHTPLANSEVKADLLTPQKSIMKLNLKKPPLQTYFQIEETPPNNEALSSTRRLKKDNRVMNRRFDQFLKSVSKMETTQKSVTDDLREDMVKMEKEMNKINLDQEELESIRDLDASRFMDPQNLNGLKKTMKRMSNLRL